MAAKDYRLGVSALTGTVYISKVSKRNHNEMTNDRRRLEAGEFEKAIAEWFENHEKKDGILTINCQGEPIIEIKQINKQ